MMCAVAEHASGDTQPAPTCPLQPCWSCIIWYQPLRVDLGLDWIFEVCRDAASCELELSTLEDVQKGLEAACFGAGGQEIYGPLADAVARTAAWLKARTERPDVRPEPGSSRRFEGIWGSLEVGPPARVHAAETAAALGGRLCTAGCLNTYARTSVQGRARSRLRDIQGSLCALSSSVP